MRLLGINQSPAFRLTVLSHTDLLGRTQSHTARLRTEGTCSDAYTRLVVIRVQTFYSFHGPLLTQGLTVQMVLGNVSVPIGFILLVEKIRLFRIISWIYM